MHTYSLKVDDDNNGIRLDIFLTKSLPDIPSRSFIQKTILAEGVTVNGKIVKSNYKVESGDQVQVVIKVLNTDSLEPENIPLEIFYEDDELVVVNKPIGMMVHPATGQYTGTLVNALLYHCRNLSNINEPPRPGIVHRLDKETSGLMLVAKTNQAHARLARLFEKRKIFKRYVALVEGSVEFDEGLIDAPLGRHPRHPEKKAVVYGGSKTAQTAYRVLKHYEHSTLIALFPRTGRTHQLRVHMAHLGHPVLGDEKYGHQESFFRLALHAQAIGFEHPQNKQYIEFFSRIPEEFLKDPK